MFSENLWMDMDQTGDILEDIGKESPEGKEVPGEGLSETAAVLEGRESGGLDDVESLASMEDVIEALGLDEDEAGLYRSLVEAIPEDAISAAGVLDGGPAVAEASGNAKVYGDCISTTCTYTMTYYSCPSTGG